MLKAKHIFKKVVRFLIAVHTHKDIDAFFGKLFERLGCTNIYILANLMKAFMDLQTFSFIPEFVQEVADFKSNIKGTLYHGILPYVSIVLQMHRIVPCVNHMHHMNI